MEEVLLEVINYVRKHKTYPTIVELGKLGITRSQIRERYGNYSELKKLVYEECSDILFDLEQDEFKTTPKKSTKRFVITTAVLGEKVHAGFLNNIRAYARDFGVELIIIPAIENINKSGWMLDPSLRNDIIITEDLSLNSNVFILGIQAKTRTVDPSTGLTRLGQRNGTFISASPKQRLKFVATGPNSLPHALMGTGTITLPSYTNAGLMPTKSTYTANYDHVMGAIILELDKGDSFHFRQIQADASGSFVDLGSLYKNGKKTFMAAEALVPGDWHSGSTDPKVVNGLMQLNTHLEPKQWILHDFFDGLSINHHIKGKNITLAKMQNKLSLENELAFLKRDLDLIRKSTKNVIIVRSNHDDFLDRYLESGTYVQEPHNHRIALQLALYKFDKINPLEVYVGRHKNVKWLGLDESYKVAGIECGVHGHLGPNGGNSSITNMETGYGKVMYGHSHTPGILRDTWNVGTSTYLDLGYNKGASSWFQTCGVIYPNGQRQLINFIEGKWTL